MVAINGSGGRATDVSSERIVPFRRFLEVTTNGKAYHLDLTGGSRVG